jgi:NodT family efflux transporter outer membrane factor (OMF) lipoprotein
MTRRALLLPILLGSVTACSMGPQHPTTPVSMAPPVASTVIAPASGPAQQIVAGGQVAPQWWRQFGSPALDALVDRALKANNDLANADAALRQAQEQARATAGGSLPQVDASYQAQRLRTSKVFSNPLQDPNNYLYSLHTAQLSVSYPLDLFGGQRAKVRSARAAAEVAADKRTAARVTVVSNLVLAVVQQASLQAQIDATNESIRSNRDILTMMQAREKLGDIGALDVSSQQTALATAEGALPPLVRQLEHQRGQIAMLIGVAPGSPLPALPSFDELKLPDTLPVGLPSEIVANRPDVQAAAAQMRGAAADLGAAIAARLPQITLSANVGGVAEKFGEMFASGNPFWALLGGATQPLFHGGQLLHQKHAAEAELDGAKAQYRGAVLQAFSDVSDALTGLRTDAEALDAATRAGDAASRNLLYSRRQLALGNIGTLALLNASASSAQANAQLIQARAARMSDAVALIQAVGGKVDD